MRSPAAELLDGAWRLALVVAPPGHGKTAVVAGWLRDSALPVVWHDLSDRENSGGDRLGIWRSVVDRARVATGGDVTDESADAQLDELLAELAGERRNGRPLVIVFDRADEVEDPSLWIDVDTLVERSGSGLRVIVIARSAAAIPSGRWRATGALVDIGPDDLGDWLDDRSDHRSEPAAARLESILRGIEPVHRQVAMRLAVPDSFDAELAVAVAGPGAGDSAILLTRRGLLERIDGGADRRRFDPLLRSLLIEELRRADPDEHRRLQLATAQHLARTGDLSSAYRTLVAAGDPDAAVSLAVQPLVDLARAGDHAGVDRAIAAIPAPATIDEPRLAVAVAGACLLTGRLALAESWVTRLDELDPPDDDDDVDFDRRSRLVRARLSLLRGDLDGAEQLLSGIDGSQLPPADRVALAGIGARLELVGRRPARARELLAAAPGDTAADWRAERESLTAWCELLEGDILAAIGRLDAVMGESEHRGERPDQTRLDATITAAWASYIGGDMATANRLAAVALGDADHLRCDWNVLRAGSVAATTLLRLSGPPAARSVLVETRLRRRSDSSPLDAELDEAEVTILRALGRIDAALAVLDAMADTPESRLLRASLETTASGAVSTPGLLDGSAAWPAAQRITAAVLTSPNDAVTLAAAVSEADRLGLVMPLTGHGATIDAALIGLPLERLHPRLAQHLNAPRASVPALTRARVEELTARERTVLALLPSHLTYDQIADRLSLSVNTVKSNLKSIYRKLSVASRSDAVDAARAARLV